MFLYKVIQDIILILGTSCMCLFIHDINKTDKSLKFCKEQIKNVNFETE